MPNLFKVLIFSILGYIFYKGDIIKKATNTARGIRNNNPLNIENNGIAWNGKIQGNDTRFITFSDSKYGIRAGAKILLNYQKLYNLDTIEKIFNRYAPPSENNTTSYAEHMASSIGVEATDKVILTKSNLKPLITAMIKHENGVQPYSTDTINSGVNMAFV